MKRAVLFSTINQTNSTKILSQIFNDELKSKTMAYMPSDGIANAAMYIEEWQGYAQRFNAGFTAIDNHSSNPTEKAKLLDSNILLISGGNTFTLLDNLRKSGLDKTIIEFCQKPEFILSGFSAGAIVLTPTINVCNLPGYDENIAGLTNLSGLNIIDFEVLPHYVESSHKKTLENYKTASPYQINTITDKDYIIVDF